jgi:hypothetical protein
MTKLIASKTPAIDLEAAAYEGQPANVRKYESGYEFFFERLNDLDTIKNDPDNSTFLTAMVNRNIATLDMLAENISDYRVSRPIDDGKFERAVIAIEEKREGKESRELVIAEWGKGFASPVHGHSDGFLYEKMISGRILVNTYRIVDLDNKLVRIVESKEYKAGDTIVHTYVPQGTSKKYKREAYVHNFVALEPSVSLHYVPEHTRDGRDNTFIVEDFTVDETEVVQINGEQGMYSAKGDVILVRSQNVPEYGDHYIIITGAPIQKPHGMRPQERIIAATSAIDSSALSSRRPLNGVTLLKLTKKGKRAFYDFHGIKEHCGKPVFLEVA